MKIAVLTRGRRLAVLSPLVVLFALAAAAGHANAAGTGPVASAGSGHPATGTTTAVRLAASAGAAHASTPIRHIVVLYLENHSFDNVLGFWCDEHPGRCPDGGMPAEVKLSNGVVVTPTVDPDTVPGVNHGVSSQLAAMHIVHGVPQMNGWQNLPSAHPTPNSSCDAASHYQCISGYKPKQIPNIIKLANDFAISDNTFSMGDSPSWGGHLYAVTASQDGFLGSIPGPVGAGPGFGCNSDKTGPWVSPTGKHERIPTCIPDFKLNHTKYPYGGAFKPTPAKWEPSILDRLNAANLSWKIYDGGGTQPAGDGWAICPSLADCWDTSGKTHEASFRDFETNAAAGTLPNFSIIIPGNVSVKNSQHNLTSMARGDNWTGQIATDIMKSSDWSSTAFFITYDDCGCFYDQAVPTRNPDGTWQGPRSPLVIISPYARPGYTDTTHTTFAGILAYVEHNFGLPALGPNDQKAYDLSGAFNYAQRPLLPIKMIKRPLPPSARHLRVTPALLNDPS